VGYFFAAPCRSGFALAMRHRLSGLNMYELNGYSKGNEHPPTPLVGVWYFYWYLVIISQLIAK